MSCISVPKKAIQPKQIDTVKIYTDSASRKVASSPTCDEVLDKCVLAVESQKKTIEEQAETIQTYEELTAAQKEELEASEKLTTKVAAGGGGISLFLLLLLLL